MSGLLPEISLSENVLFISSLGVHCTSFFPSLEYLGISHVLTREWQLQEIAQLSAGRRCTRREHMSNCCICDSNLLNVQTQPSIFGIINMLLAYADPLLYNLDLWQHCKLMMRNLFLRNHCSGIKQTGKSCHQHAWFCICEICFGLT